MIMSNRFIGKISVWQHIAHSILYYIKLFYAKFGR